MRCARRSPAIGVSGHHGNPRSRVYGRQKGHTEVYRGAEYVREFSAQNCGSKSPSRLTLPAKAVEVITSRRGAPDRSADGKIFRNPDRSRPYGSGPARPIATHFNSAIRPRPADAVTAALGAVPGGWRWVGAPLFSYGMASKIFEAR